MLEYTIQENDQAINVLLCGDLDFESTEIVQDDLIHQIPSQRTCVLDFEDVAFVDSTGLGLLIQLVKKLKENESFIQIIHVNEDILNVFELVQIEEIIGESVIIKEM